MKRKPVKFVSVIICLLLVVALASTLIIPIFNINLNIGGVESGFVDITGLDIIKILFGSTEDFASQPESIQTLLTFLNRGLVNVGQYINPMYINTMMITYVVSICLSIIMLITTLFNFAGIRFSVINVFCGLGTMVCGIISAVCIILQKGELVNNILLEYDFRLAIGVVILIVAGFVYMMVAPKKRV